MTWLLLQLADSAFPTGGFAHSGGLEAAVQLGAVDGPEQLERLAAEALWSTAWGALPFVAAAHQAPDRLLALDAACDATLPGHVANRASRALGAAFLRAASEALGAPAAALAEEVRRAGAPGHLAPAFGAVLGRLETSLEEVRRLYLFQAVRALVSAGVRLGAAGPLEAQALLARLAPEAEAALRASEGCPPEEACGAAPLLDLLQGQQDRLYSRLFQS
ncbi:MAG: urease accessory UreF family protein [Anaeromyxobacter sp.]